MRLLASPFSETIDTPTAFIREVQIVAVRGAVNATLSPSAGSLTQDARRGMRWSGSLTIPIDDPALLPTVPGDLLTPFGTLVVVALGVTLAAGVTDVVPYGTYVVDGADVSLAAGERIVTLTLLDLADRIAKYRFEDPYMVASGEDLAAGINEVILDRTGIDPNLADTGAILQRERVFGLDPTLDPWRELGALASDFGYRLWYSRDGTLVLDQQPVGDPADAVDLVGPLTIHGTFDHRPPNVIVARGEASNDNPPVQAIVMDDDPTSPTYAGTTPNDSPYGRVTQYHASPLLSSTGEAQLAGESILARQAGAGATWTASRAYDPQLDCDDVLQVDLDDTHSLPLMVDQVTVDVVGETSISLRALSQLTA